MKISKLIPWEDVRKEMFTKEELKEMDIKAEKRIALRQIRELRESFNLTQDTLSIKSKLSLTISSLIAVFISSLVCPVIKNGFVEKPVLRMFLILHCFLLGTVTTFLQIFSTSLSLWLVAYTIAGTFSV